MLITSLLLALATLQQGADTTLTARRGQRLEASVYAGSITVKTWSRDAVRIQADTRRKDHLDISADGSTSVRSIARSHPPDTVAGFAILSRRACVAPQKTSSTDSPSASNPISARAIFSRNRNVQAMGVRLEA